MVEQVLATVQTEQWGWEYRGREVVVVEHEEPPVPLVPEPTGLARLEAKRATALRTRFVLTWAVVGGGLLTAGVGLASHPLLALVPGALTLGFAWLRWGRPELLRRATVHEHHRWLTACSDSMARFETDVETWRQELKDQERTTGQQAAAVRPWVPVGPATKERVDLYGGTTAGWRAALLAMGSSLMSAGGRLTVLDLTQDAVAEPLRQMAEDHGAPIRSTVLPDEKRSLNLLAGLSAEEIGVVIAEGLRVAEAEPTESRGVDATLVQQVVECLADSPVTMRRLHLAFQVLLRQLPPDQRGELTRAEYGTLTDLLSEAARRTAEPRLFRLAAGLTRLAGVSGDVAMDGWDGEEISLRVIQLSHRESELTASLFRQLVFQVAMSRIQRGQMSGRGERIVVIAGADVLARPDLERFDSICRRNGLRLVLLFAHLRDSARWSCSAVGTRCSSCVWEMRRKPNRRRPSSAVSIAWWRASSPTPTGPTPLSPRRIAPRGATVPPRATLSEYRRRTVGRRRSDCSSADGTDRGAGAAGAVFVQHHWWIVVVGIDIDLGVEGNERKHINRLPTDLRVLDRADSPPGIVADRVHPDGSARPSQSPSRRLRSTLG